MAKSYLPDSVLSAFSKVFERLVSRHVDLLEKCDLLSDFQ